MMLLQFCIFVQYWPKQNKTKTVFVLFVLFCLGQYCTNMQNCKNISINDASLRPRWSLNGMVWKTNQKNPAMTEFFSFKNAKKECILLLKLLPTWTSSFWVWTFRLRQNTKNLAKVKFTIFLDWEVLQFIFSLPDKSRYYYVVCQNVYSR